MGNLRVHDKKGSWAKNARKLWSLMWHGQNICAIPETKTGKKERWVSKRQLVAIFTKIK